MLITGKETGATIEAIRRSEHPYPEVMKTEETEIELQRKRSGMVTLLRHLARRAARLRQLFGRR